MTWNGSVDLWSRSEEAKPTLLLNALSEAQTVLLTQMESSAQNSVGFRSIYS